MLDFITSLTDEELDAVAAGATASVTVEATAIGLTKAEVLGTQTVAAETTKTGEAAVAVTSFTVTTA